MAYVPDAHVRQVAQLWRQARLLARASLGQPVAEEFRQASLDLRRDQPDRSESLDVDTIVEYPRLAIVTLSASGRRRN